MRAGVIYHVHERRTFCFVRDLQDKQEYFAHSADFPDPTIMQVGQRVCFRPKLARRPDAKNPAATDVIAETAALTAQ